MTSSASDVRRALSSESDPADAEHLQRYFKTGEGEYGEGDVFIGVRVPAVRAIVKAHADLPPAAVEELLDSPVHEHRMAALLVLVAQFSRVVTGDERDRIVDVYLAALRRGCIDNWDLVDCSAEYILGEYLYDRPRGVLTELAASDSVWHRRVAVITTFGFIRRGDTTTTFALAERLLDDPHDLIHKAVGWMLREVGKRVDRAPLLDFLDVHAARMPRTMLSYATEHLEPALRAHYRSL